jgi:hypothetical protein
MNLPLAERFKAPQGEGLYTGTPMAFMRTVGCSVGHGVCTMCDTDFDKMLPEMGGGLYTVEDLLEWVGDFKHVCLTGGEPLDRNLSELIIALADRDVLVHVETSGTRLPRWLGSEGPGQHYVQLADGFYPIKLWLTVSPKPGWRPGVINLADEIKVILGGLGDGPGWPTLEDAVSWAQDGKLVYLQSCNDKKELRDGARALSAVLGHPELRLSTQMQKVWGVR